MKAKVFTYMELHYILFHAKKSIAENFRKYDKEFDEQMFDFLESLIKEIDTSEYHFFKLTEDEPF